MKKFLFSSLMLALVLISCEDDASFEAIEQGDYPVKEYYLERNPLVNVWGAGLDLIHDECQLESTDLDYTYLTDSSEVDYDLNFYAVKAISYTSSGDTKIAGVPALLLSSDTKACKLGEGVDFFDSLTVITEDMIALLAYEPQIDYSTLLDTGGVYYDYDLLYDALSSCIIGDDFRGTELVIPEGKTEEEVQAVYLIESAEGGYTKFMVKQFKPDQPNDKQTLIRWQVISE